ncbi:unnamed protein product [Rotaria sp. Silwood2]|nr:unnamed protein product [Rotaria sp. Silwood2]CAF4620366.1 unnamed protein product [Rotaria sp. Silwood2]
MVVNDGLRLSIDLLQMSHEFRKRSITLAIVSSETPPFEIWDLYRTSAHNTGGKYMFLTDAPRILSRVILSVVKEENTFHQAFFNVSRENVSTLTNIVGRMEQERGTMNNMVNGDFDFNHGLSY